MSHNIITASGGYDSIHGHFIEKTEVMTVVKATIMAEIMLVEELSMANTSDNRGGGGNDNESDNSDGGWQLDNSNVRDGIDGGANNG